MNKITAFTTQHLQNLLDVWKSDYKLKTHDGEIRSIEMTKSYEVSGPITTANTFIINVCRMYKYMTVSKQGDTITLSISVKPETVNDFLAFCNELQLQEQTSEDGLTK